MIQKLTFALLVLMAAGTSVQAQKKASARQVAKEQKAMLAAKEQGLRSINLNSAQTIVDFLASDELEGREAGQPGGRIAARYVAAWLREIGIAPLSQMAVPALAPMAVTDVAATPAPDAPATPAPNTGAPIAICPRNPYSPLEVYYQPFGAVARERQQRHARWQVHPDSIALLKQATHRTLRMYNVLGYIPGQRADEYVIVGAHFDHLGIDPSLAYDPIYNGADDNASGVQAVLQIARAFVASGRQPLRTVIFALWDGEEKGLLGSQHFVQNFPAIEQVKGYLNFDMIGRNNKPENPRHVVYFYTEAHPKFEQWLRRDVAEYNLPIDPFYRPWDRPIGGGDNGSFAKRDIPIIWYHTDGHPDYHQPSDHADRLNWEKVIGITQAAYLNMWDLANEEEF